MHELALSRAIVDTVARHADERRVTRVQMRIGALRQVVPESLAFYLEIVSRDTVCAGAAFEYELVPALLACRRCEGRWDPAPPPEPTHGPGIDPMESQLPSFRCPSCGAGGDVLEGDALEVESITVEEPEPRGRTKEDGCIAPR